MSYYNKYLKYKYKYLHGGKKMKDIYIRPLYNKVNNTMSKTISISEPWFTLITLGLKTIEGRKNSGIFANIKVDDVITWTNDTFGLRSITTKVTRIAKYTTFVEYLQTETLAKCLPGIKDMETGLSVYYKYYTKEDEKQYGVIAIELQLI